jgi:tetratricopeptide (TPR) repeat protein
VHTGVALSCGAVLILITFFLVPCTHADTQGLTGLWAQADIQPTGDVESSEANQEAIEKLRRMSPEEIKALDQKLAEAIVLYYDREFARALPIFKEIADKVETMDIMFWVGTSAMKVGETQLAIRNFKKMLAIDPKLHRVRLELAAAYFTMGHYDEARHELELVQAASLPPGVQKNIARLLAAIEERTRKVFWNLRLSEGYLWDDNINAGPGKKELAVVGGTLTLDKESTKLEDEATVTNVAGNLIHDMGERNGLMWNTAASFYNLAYREYGSDFNYMAMDVTTGPWWARRSDILKVPLGYTRLKYGNKRLSYVCHADPNYEYHFNQYFSLKGLYSYSTTHYYDISNSNLDNKKNRYELTPNIYLANRRHIVSATAGYEDHNADVDRYTYDGPYCALSYFAGFLTSTELFLRYQWMERDYDEKPLLYNKLREDMRHNFTAVLSQGFLTYFFASYSFNYTDNSSNCPLYDFDKRTHTVSVGCRF